MRIELKDLAEMDRIRRLTFVNAISGFKGVHLVGTVSGAGLTNLAVFSSVVHLGSDPALLGIVTRPIDGALKTTRHTYRNIEETRYFTLNQVHAGILDRAHQTSAAYPDGVSEFDAVGLTPRWSTNLPAPYVAECRICLGMRFEESYKIRANQTLLIVGAVVEIELPDEVVGASGHVDLEAAGSLALCGLDRYYAPKFLKELGYARIKT